jgi:hypothetical protein
MSEHMSRRDMAVLWLAGSGIDESTTTAILEDKRVKYVLEQAPKDWVWLMEVFNGTALQLGLSVQPVDRHNAKEQLKFAGLFGQ